MKMRKENLLIAILYVFCWLTAIVSEAETAQAGTSYRSLFNAEYYYQNNPDVAEAFGDDEEALYTHFVNYGIFEGRSGDTEFDVNAYRARYEDLDAVFGDNLESYYEHYIMFGREEQRVATTDGIPYNLFDDISDLSNAAASGDVTEPVEPQASAISDSSVSDTDTASKNEIPDTEPADVAVSTEETVAVSTAPPLVLKDEPTPAETRTVAAKTSSSKENTKEPARTVNEPVETVSPVHGIPAPETENDLDKVQGTYYTNYNESEARATNIKVAAKRINGTLVQPGDSFSFSNIVLERTEENGYVVAPVVVSGKKAQGVGGGICQVSSTLYAAMLTAGVPATERHAHSLQMSYIPEGMDATIAGDTKDLKFTNIYEQPLIIHAIASNGNLVVSITTV